MNDRERMVISAHIDGEVEAPWKAAVERKLAEDPDWKAEAELHAKVSSALARAPEPDFAAARGRVWDRLSVRAPRPVTRLPLTWISVAAAALVLLAAGGGYWAGRAAAPSGPASVAELQVQVPKQLELKLSGEGQLLMASTLEGPRR